MLVDEDSESIDDIPELQKRGLQLRSISYKALFSVTVCEEI